MLSRFLYLLFVLSFIPSDACAQLANFSPSTEEIVTQSRSCSGTAKNLLPCTYKVGENLEFKISSESHGIAVQVINMGNPEGDYFLDLNGVTLILIDTKPHYGYQFLFYNSCIPVAAGAQTVQNASYKTADQYAYVSPGNGRVYTDPEICENITKAAFKSASGSSYERSDLQRVKNMMIRSSINAYDGPCPCPYNIMRNGRTCGVNSAYSKPGGRSPLCYESDISDEEAARYLK